MNKKMTTLRLCMIAMAVCINVAGGQLALMLRLPIYLDSIGTILIGAWWAHFMGAPKHDSVESLWDLQQIFILCTLHRSA